jgi:hypothetical protein
MTHTHEPTEAEAIQQDARRYRFLKNELARREADGRRVNLDWIYSSDVDAVIDSRLRMVSPTQGAS